MTPLAEPLMLRLPRELLVLQPMQGHLDLEPVLLAPGFRCAIGSSKDCAVRLMNSELVQPEHFVIAIVGRATTLTDWTPGSTWLNDRLVIEPRELVPGDRISIGPFDFRVRPASADELLYAKLVEREPGTANNADDVLRLKRAFDSSGRDKSTALTAANSEPALDLFSELLRETGDGTNSDSHDRLTQHISKLLGDLQNQVLALQDKEAELNQQLRTRNEVAIPQPLESTQFEPESESLKRSIPEAVHPEYDQVLHLLKSERDQLDLERRQLTEQQAEWKQQKNDWTQRLQTLETQLADLETERQAVLAERENCRTLAAELMRDQAHLTEWQDRIVRETWELTSLRDRLSPMGCAVSEPPVEPGSVDSSHSQPVSTHSEASSSAVPPHRSGPEFLPDEPVPGTLPGRPIQTLLTLVAFSLSAVFLSGSLGDQAVQPTIGWATAILGAISTADLMLRRCFSVERSVN